MSWLSASQGDSPVILSPSSGRGGTEVRKDAHTSWLRSTTGNPPGYLECVLRQQSSAVRGLDSRARLLGVTPPLLATNWGTLGELFIFSEPLFIYPSNEDNSRTFLGELSGGLKERVDTER